MSEGRKEQTTVVQPGGNFRGGPDGDQWGGRPTRPRTSRVPSAACWVI